ncbi:PKD domain-containing protein [Vibrio sinaloensis]|uniref:PKD domain-containing protein n=1 Tax=Photobacterium sp. (strain ATCC 43367) TaxID=379097 RepID=UPI00205E5F38|nr:hypothetical protein [Vibrio sinaloensis]UPQ87175.1 hypothetical protein MTO69_09045 [Vibrio sinaloensis]
MYAGSSLFSVKRHQITEQVNLKQTMHGLMRLLFVLVTIAASGCGSGSSDVEKYTKPTVNAGSDKVYTLPQSQITLSGSAKTYPKHVYSIKETKWTQTAGPAQLTILNADKLTATILNPTITGSYRFELYVKDSGGRSNTDSVTIILTQSAEVAAARSSLTYSDDYDLMWNTLASDPNRYPAVEDEWQVLYQPYLVEADQIESHQQWLELVTKMVEELETDSFELHKLNLANSTEKGQSVVWSQNNGVGTVAFHALHAFSSQALLLELDTALAKLSSTKDIELDFSASGAFDDQIFLALLTRLTTTNMRLCLAGTDAEQGCVTIAANDKLRGVSLRVRGAEHSKSAAQLAEYIDTINLGGDTFSFTPSLPLTSGLILQ